MVDHKNELVTSSWAENSEKYGRDNTSSADDRKKQALALPAQGVINGMATYAARVGGCVRASVWPVHVQFGTPHTELSAQMGLSHAVQKDAVIR
jgi:hypothetical protein